MSEKKKVQIPASLTSGQLSPQSEVLEIAPKKSKLFIGIPKESMAQENRVALVPASVKSLTNNGHNIVLEREAGLKSNYSDHDYSEKGARIAYDAKQVYEADVLLKVAPPSLDEIEMMRPNQVLISPLHLPIINEEYLFRLKNKRVIALAMEYIQDEDGTFPMVRILSEMAGINAMHVAAELMSTTQGGKGLLLGGISGVPPARVVILGAGVVAETAVRAALGLGAEVRVFDNNIYKLKRLKDLIGYPIYTSAINSVHLEKELMRADVAIGAIHSKTGRSPLVVSEDMVERMKPGSVIVDVSIDQGGCFATSKVTTLAKPTFVEHDVIHYCVPNIASRVPRTASLAMSNILTSILAKAANSGSVEALIKQQEGLRNGVYTYKGSLTNQYLGERFNMKSTDLDLLITSSL